MNINSEVKRTHDQSQSAGARRLRRFTARMVLGVRESQAWRTLKRPEGRAPFVPHDATWDFGMNTSREELLFALFSLPTSRERESTNLVGVRRRRVVPFSTTPDGSAATNVLTGIGSEASVYLDQTAKAAFYTAAIQVKNS